MKLDLNEKIKIPEGIEVKVDGKTILTKGPKGEVSRNLSSPKIDIVIKGNIIILSSKKATKREKTMIGTFKSHIKNMIQGALEGYVYTLKICSTHFPMTAEIKNNYFSVGNFLGESTPRSFKLREGVNVKIEGDKITVESTDKELAGLTASAIENLCRITNRDRRIFQDGIYMTLKAGKEIK